MTETERAILDALGKVKLGKFGQARDFVADLTAKAARGDPTLKPKQTDYLYSLRHTHREQISALDGPPVPGGAEGKAAFKRYQEERQARKAQGPANQDGRML